jgi:lysyl-tRNA synthetase class 1
MQPIQLSADIFRSAKAWPCQEAARIAKAIKKDKGTKDNPVVFETGYGPSGLPHIGTFGEVLRTSMVRHAFEEMTGLSSILIAFSDDMDGLRKVPDNVPNQEMLQKYLHYPLTQVPDPFGEYDSFAAHNNARLCAFLDEFGFDYQFYSATKQYQSGVFDHALLRMLEVYDDVMAIMLPSLGKERQASYSPFLPICPETNHVLQVPVLEWDAKAGTILYQRDDGVKVETPVTSGACKLQWKPDWAMRWYALGVDFEMAGKDLIDSVKLASKICRVLGSPPPVDYHYELFLDEEAKKISKSKGNGLAMEDWLKYAPRESLAYYMYQKPKTAKRLYFDVIPKAVDEYAQQLTALRTQEAEKQIENPVYHIHHAQMPDLFPISYSLLLTLASVCNSDQPSVLWGFINKYDDDLAPMPSAEEHAILQYAIDYYNDRIQPYKDYSILEGRDREAVQRLYDDLGNDILVGDASATTIQNLIYRIGTDAGYDPLREWFLVLYRSLLGQEQGPRMGSLFALYGIEQSRNLIQEALQR